MLSCFPRVALWVARFSELMAARTEAAQDPFVSNLFQYLNGVAALTPGWISNGSDVTGAAPSSLVVSKAIDLLSLMYRAEKYRELFHSKSVILGPLIGGGIGVEARSDDKSWQIVVSLANDGTSIIEEMYDGEWSESSTSLDFVLDVMANRSTESVVIRPKFPSR